MKKHKESYSEQISFTTTPLKGNIKSKYLDSDLTHFDSDQFAPTTNCIHSELNDLSLILKMF